MSIIKKIKEINKLAKCKTSEYVCVEDVYTIQKIKIKYFDKEIDKLEYIGGGKSNWIDLRSAETIHLKKGEFRLIPLGV